MPIIADVAEAIADVAKRSEVLGVLDARLISNPQLEIEILAILVMTGSRERGGCTNLLLKPCCFCFTERRFERSVCFGLS